MLRIGVCKQLSHQKAGEELAVGFSPDLIDEIERTPMRRWASGHYVAGGLVIGTKSNLANASLGIRGQSPVRHEFGIAIRPKLTLHADRGICRFTRASHRSPR